MRTLVLRDIDRMLINPGGVSAEIYGTVFRRHPAAGLRVSGAETVPPDLTDTPAVVRAILRA